jgi:GNAT superfamily N-acetyltransferase
VLTALKLTPSAARHANGAVPDSAPPVHPRRRGAADSYNCGVERLRLRPMTAAEFVALLEQLIPRYAVEKIRAGDWAEDQAEALAAKQTAELLPEGPDTPGMLLLTADDQAGQPIGRVWVALDRPRPGEAWIYDIQINPERRSKGYGRALLQAAEQEAARHGTTSIGLNVFGSNAVARNLYESSGYQIAAINMRKELTAAP